MTTQTQVRSTEEALKLALEALYFLPALSPAQNELQDGAIEAIKKALAQPAVTESHKHEPVAVRTMRMWITALKSVSDNGQHMKIPSGLSSGTCWELAVELERFIDTTPPQRTAAVGEDTQRAWVGLSAYEMQELYLQNHEAWQSFACAIEAKLKEKNNGT